MQLIKNKYHTLQANFGKSKTNKTVQYQILNYDLTIKQDYTASGVMELGDGNYAGGGDGANGLVLVYW